MEGQYGIRMDVEEIGINAGIWVYSPQDRNYWRALVNAALNLRVPLAMELVKLGFHDLISKSRALTNNVQIFIFTYARARCKVLA